MAHSSTTAAADKIIDKLAEVLFKYNIPIAEDKTTLLSTGIEDFPSTIGAAGMPFKRTSKVNYLDSVTGDTD